MSTPSLLPIASTSASSPLSKPWWTRPQFTKRYSRVLFLILLSAAMVVLFLSRQDESLLIPVEFDSASLPPTFDAWHHYEESLQSKPRPSGPYIYFANHAHGSGWGNIMQELLLNSHLSHEAGWTYVFDNYTWSKDMSSPYAVFNGKTIPARIPLTALIGGAVVDDAISLPEFRRVCPKEETTVVKTADVRDGLASLGQSDGAEVLETWVKELRRLQETGVRCVEIDEASLHVFDIWLFGSENVLSLFPRLRDSRVLKTLEWSPLTLKTFEMNRRMFEGVGGWWNWNWPFPRTNDYPIPIPRSLPSTPYPPLSGLIALHIRRGDFEEHCRNLADWNSKFNGFNMFPELEDHFDPPRDDSKMDYYLRRCYPTIEQIVDKVQELRREMPHLDRVYVMSNGAKEWLGELKDALDAIGGWKDDGVHTSRDLQHRYREEKYVAQATDMYIAQRAEVFVGNGFSSLTSNVALLRMASKPHTHRHPEKTTRMW